MKDTIRRLAKEKNAILLAHNYQPPEILEVADLSGDSLELSIKAAKTDAKVILFCGVHFMAETASILSPDKTVLLPRLDAGCPMADTIQPGPLKEKIESLGNIPVVTYVNSTAAVKALSTICCTSANVIKVVNSLNETELLLTPDRNLAEYAAANTDKKIHFWEGCCPVHDCLSAMDLKKAKAAHPKAEVIAHPECRPEVLDMADRILSTSGMIRYAGDSEAEEFIVATETGLIYTLEKRNAGKLFHPASDRMICKEMKKITLKDIKRSLETLEPEVKVPENIRKPAFMAVKRMLDISF